jgi:Flp pilus assembly protein TadD
MRRRSPILLAGFFFVLLTTNLWPQQDDPSEIFLKAYLSAQQGERLEQENRFKTALAKYRFAGSLIEELRKSHPDWQPAIVEYRGRKIGEGILRIQERISRQNELSAAASRLPELVPSMAETEAWSEPGPEVVAPQGFETISQPSGDAAIEEATKKLRRRVDQLQAVLEKSRSDLETARKEKEAVNTRLRETSSKLENAQKEIEKSKESENQARDQLGQTQASLKTLQTAHGNSTMEQQQLRAQIDDLKNAVAVAEEARATAERQRDEANAKLAETTNQMVALGQERDEALAQLEGVREATQRAEALTAENSNLKQKLANAEKKLGEFSESNPTNAEEFSEMRQQLMQLRQQLSETQKENQYLGARIAELRVQLDDASLNLQKAKLSGADSEDTARLARENELLRGIVVRERQEEARRYQAKERVLAELAKLEIKSDLLNEQIELLSQPVTKLNSEELALLGEPVVSISDQDHGMLKASFIFPAKSSAEANADTDEKSSPDSGELKIEHFDAVRLSSGSIVGVPEDLRDFASAARENFEQGKYELAGKRYQEILDKSPDNLYALSNLGVVYFRSGQIELAEATLKKALALSPDDEFVLTTLGIVHYRQSNFEDALAELSKAIKVNPNSATAHNYLGIVAGQKGRTHEAEKEILQAIANDPDYADAHFNLAVILATMHPASKELAKQHYAKATALGTQPSPSLERLLR